MDLIEKVVDVSKRRGFIFPSSEIYGGMANTYDFGPYGTSLKENIRRIWWNKFITNRREIYGIDSSIILNPKVWEASGHVAQFGDSMIDCKNCHFRTRADHLIEDYLDQHSGRILNSRNFPEILDTGTFNRQEELIAIVESKKVEGLTAKQLNFLITWLKIRCPQCEEVEWTEVRKFNLLFKTEIGIIEGEGSTAYLRGEIAQGLFINFKNILDSLHPSLPFGIGQTGKAFRNEITKGQFTFRTLEFDLMEFEYFFDPNTLENEDWGSLFDLWKLQMKSFTEDIGLNQGKLRWRSHADKELSHYSKRTEDLEYEFPWGFKEMFGIAYRGDFDLKNHQEHSGISQEYTYPDGKKVIPHVIEPTFGLSRLVTIVLMDAFSEEEVDGEKRIVLKFDPKIAPVKVAVLPLIKKAELTNLAGEICETLKSIGEVVYEETASIGKRYRKQDEIGTPYCITIDFDSLEDKKVTVRDRDTMKQERVEISKLLDYLSPKFL